MTSATPVHLVTELWRFPVKSMGGELLDETSVTDQGVLGDRGFALVDLETASVVSASNKLFPGLIDWQAAYLEQPRPDAELPAVRITPSTGNAWTTDDPAFDCRISAHFRRDVALVRGRPEAYAAKQAAFFASIGVADVAPIATLVDFCPVSVITTATFAELSRVRPQSRFDPRRFRMNIVVSSTKAGFAENTWVGGQLSVGNDVRLRVTIPDPRCSMTTLAQGDLEKDPSILRTIAEANSLPVGSGGAQPCAGVYATVARVGVVRRRDPVLLS